MDTKSVAGRDCVQQTGSDTGSHMEWTGSQRIGRDTIIVQKGSHREAKGDGQEVSMSLV